MPAYLTDLPNAAQVRFSLILFTEKIAKQIYEYIYSSYKLLYKDLLMAVPIEIEQKGQQSFAQQQAYNAYMYVHAQIR